MKRIILTMMAFICLTTNAQSLRLSMLNPQTQTDNEMVVCRLTTQQATALTSVVANGELQYTSNMGFVRVLLRDANGHEKLVYESFPALAINGVDCFSFTSMETNAIGSFIPSKVVVQSEGCDLSDLELYLRGIEGLIATDSLEHCTATTITAAEEIMLAPPQGVVQESYVDRLNAALEASGALWRAKETSISTMSYEEKKVFYGGCVPVPNGLPYYAKGIFTFWDDSYNNVDTISLSAYPKEIDWRNRHGAMIKASPYFQSEVDGWCTPVKLPMLTI